MQQARAKVFTKHISAVVSPEDYEFLKKASEDYEISLGDVLRGIIKIGRQTIESGTNSQEQRLF